MKVRKGFEFGRHFWFLTDGALDDLGFGCAPSRRTFLLDLAVLTGKVMAVLVVLECGLGLIVVALMSFGRSSSFQSKSHDTTFVMEKNDLNRLKCET